MLRDDDAGASIEIMLTGLALKVLSTLCFTAMAVCVRYAAAYKCPVAEIVFFRSAFALIPLLVWLRLIGGLPLHLKTMRPLGHLGRGLTGSAGMFANFLALSLLPLADATAYFYAYPIFLTLIAGLVLREKVGAARWTAVAVGFGGVFAMLSEQMGAGGSAAHVSREGVGAAVALSGAFFAAVSIAQTRRLTLSEHTGAIVFYFTCLTTFFGALILVLAHFWPAGAPASQFFASQAYVAPNGRQWAALIGVGAAGGAAQIFSTSSYRFAEVSLLAAFDYLTLFWAMPASLIFFGQRPSAVVMIGAAAIGGAGVLAVWSERRARREILAT